MSAANTTQLHTIAKSAIQGMILEGSILAGNAATVLSGWYLHGDLSTALENLLHRDLDAKSVAPLQTEKKVAYVFKLLRPENAPRKKIVLTDSEFRIFRRAVGARNYERAFRLLSVVHDTALNNDHRRAIALAAEILGSVKGASAHYHKFKPKFAIE